jgi:hypothetical protein
MAAHKGRTWRRKYAPGDRLANAVLQTTLYGSFRTGKSWQRLDADEQSSGKGRSLLTSTLADWAMPGEVPHRRLSSIPRPQELVELVIGDGACDSRGTLARQCCFPPGQLREGPHLPVDSQLCHLQHYPVSPLLSRRAAETQVVRRCPFRVCSVVKGCSCPSPTPTLSPLPG